MERTAVGTSRGADETAAEVVEQPRLAWERKDTKVMVAMDDSDGSFYALKWTLDYFFNLNTNLRVDQVRTSDDDDQPAGTGSESSMIILVNVQRPFQPFVYPAGPVIYPTTTVIESVKKGQEENATAVLGRALQMCKDKKVKAETMILQGDPKDRICQVAEELHVDLVVVGCRGLGTIKRAFLGSVSDYCAHHVQCPILIVKPPKKNVEDK